MSVIISKSRLAVLENHGRRQLIRWENEAVGLEGIAGEDYQHLIRRFCTLHGIGPGDGMYYREEYIRPNVFGVSIFWSEHRGFVGQAPPGKCTGCDGRGWFELFSTGRQACERCSGTGKA